MTSRVAYGEGKHSRGTTCFITKPLPRGWLPAMRLAIVGHRLLAPAGLPGGNSLRQRWVSDGQDLRRRNRRSLRLKHEQRRHPTRHAHRREEIHASESLAAG